MWVLYILLGFLSIQLTIILACLRGITNQLDHSRIVLQAINTRMKTSDNKPSG